MVVFFWWMPLTPGRLQYRIRTDRKMKKHNQPKKIFHNVISLLILERSQCRQLRREWSLGQHPGLVPEIPTQPRLQQRTQPTTLPKAPQQDLTNTAQSRIHHTDTQQHIRIAYVKQPIPPAAQYSPKHEAQLELHRHQHHTNLRSSITSGVM